MRKNLLMGSGATLRGTNNGDVTATYNVAPRAVVYATGSSLQVFRS
jgi:hypothetical protein